MSTIETNANKAEKFLKAMANEHRLKILCQLAESDKSVSELINATKIAQTSMSQHLLKLKDEGLVDYSRNHRTLTYKIINKDVLKIMNVLHSKYCK